MGMLPEDAKKKLKAVLDGMDENVTLLYFTQEYECMFCKETRTFLEEFREMSSKIEFQEYDFVKNSDIAKMYGVDKIPAIVIADSRKENTRMKFYGIPAGYEINSFVTAILETSTRGFKYSSKIEERIKKIDKDIHIQVFVSLGCPYCPDAVITAHRLAFRNPKIKADMVETTIFGYIANRYNVTGVPKIVINEKYELVGAQPVEEFMELIEKI